MDSKKFTETWKRYAIGTGVAAIFFVVFGSVMDKNPVMTLMVGGLAFVVANVAFVGIQLLVDPPKS